MAVARFTDRLLILAGAASEAYRSRTEILFVPELPYAAPERFLSDARDDEGRFLSRRSLRTPGGSFDGDLMQ